MKMTKKELKIAEAAVLEHRRRTVENKKRFKQVLNEEAKEGERRGAILTFKPLGTGERYAVIATNASTRNILMRNAALEEEAPLRFKTKKTKKELPLRGITYCNKADLSQVKKLIKEIDNKKKPYREKVRRVEKKLLSYGDWDIEW